MNDADEAEIRRIGFSGFGVVLGLEATQPVWGGELYARTRADTRGHLDGQQTAREQRSGIQWTIAWCCSHDR